MDRVQLEPLVLRDKQDKVSLLEVRRVKYWSRQLGMIMLLSGLLLVVEVVVTKGHKGILALLEQQGQMPNGIF